MKKAYIKSISYYLPDKVVTNEELVADFPEWTVEKIADKVGVKERHVAVDSETATDLAVKAAEKLFAENLEITKDSIDFIVFCTQSPDYLLPTSACLIQERLGLRTDIGAFDFNLGCSGYVYGLSIAKGLIAGGIATNVLLLTGETYNKHLHPRDKGNRTIFGDAAGLLFQLKVLQKLVNLPSEQMAVELRILSSRLVDHAIQKKREILVLTIMEIPVRLTTSL